MEVWRYLRSPDDEEDTGGLSGHLAAYGCTALACELAHVGERIATMSREVAAGKVTTKAARDVLLFYGWDEKAQ